MSFRQFFASFRQVLGCYGSFGIFRYLPQAHAPIYHLPISNQKGLSYSENAHVNTTRQTNEAHEING